MFAARLRESYELLLWHQVDEVFSRILRAKLIVRPQVVDEYCVLDRHSPRSRAASVFRAWEVDHVRKSLPKFMVEGRYKYFTGNWKGIPVSSAPKSLHDASKFPYVYEATLPQHRLERDGVPKPRQDQYPVW